MEREEEDVVDLTGDSLTSYLYLLLETDGVVKADDDEARRKPQVAAAEAIIFPMVRIQK